MCFVDSDGFDAKRNLPTSKNVRDYVVLGVSRVWHRENLFGNVAEKLHDEAEKLHDVAEKPHDVAEKLHDVAEKAMLLSCFVHGLFGQDLK